VSRELNERFTASNGDLKGLIVSMVTHPDFRLAHFETEAP
jgi:hypothetical protein